MGLPGRLARKAVARVKVCCISSVEEAALAVRHGASALGLVSKMPSGPGVIGEPAIAAIAKTVPPGVSTFLLTAASDAEAIIAQQRRCGVDTIQLVDAVPIETYAALRSALPGVRVVQVIHVQGRGAVEQAKSVAPHVQAILLDSGNPTAQTPTLGGTGLMHDHTISSEVVASVSVPVFLAGGLRAGNVAAAIAQVRPFGVDLCSGVRTDGALDEAKLADFMHAVRGS